LLRARRRGCYRGTAVRPESDEPPLEAPLGETVPPPPPPPDDPDDDDDEEDPDDEDDDEEPESDGKDFEVEAVSAVWVFVAGVESRWVIRV